MMRRLLLGIWWALALATPVWAFQPPPAQGEYLPVKDLPPVDQLPAAPLLVAAYSFIWLAAMFYLWTIWRRLNKVEAEMRTLEQRRTRSGGR
jgi:CcmD family protein